MRGENKLAVKTQQRRNWPVGLFHRDLADKLEPFFFFEDGICNFGISGQGDRAHLICSVLDNAAGRLPVIVLHNEDHAIMAEIARVWQEKYGALDNGPLWSCNTGGFEPLLGLNDEDIICIMKKLAQSAGYTTTAAFERVVDAHLNILHYMDCDNSLSGLNYLCGFRNLEEFQSNILLLDCGEREASRILADMGLADPAGREQFDIFRSVIRTLSTQAKKSGWKDGTQNAGFMSVSSAIENRALMTLSVSPSSAPLLMTYLGQEILLHNKAQCLLLIDDVMLENSEIIPALREAGFDFRFGILGSNILEMMDADQTQAQRFCEKLDVLVLLRHNVNTTADAMSELLGTMQVSKESNAVGSGRGFFSLLPSTAHKTVTYTTEDQRRVKPEQIMNLRDEAIVFHTASNQIFLV